MIMGIPQFASISLHRTDKRSSNNISNIIVASPLCTILQQTALDCLNDLDAHIRDVTPSSTINKYNINANVNICKSVQGLELYYLCLCGNSVDTAARFCAGVLSLSSPTKNTNSPSPRSSALVAVTQKPKSSTDDGDDDGDGGTPIIVVCVGVAGCAASNTSCSPLLHVLPLRLHESAKLLSRLGKSLQMQENSAEGKKWVRALLASLICEEDDLRTNAEVLAMNKNNAASATPSASESARVSAQKYQVLNVSEEMMVPLDQYTMSIPPVSSPMSSTSRGSMYRKSGHFNSYHAHHNNMSSLQAGFDYVPPVHVFDLFSSDSSSTFSRTNKRRLRHPSSPSTHTTTPSKSMQQKVKLPTPFITPLKRSPPHWRNKNLLKQKHAETLGNYKVKTTPNPKTQKEDTVDGSIQTPDPDNSSSSTPSSPVRILASLRRSSQLRLPPSPSASSISHASSLTPRSKESSSANGSAISESLAKQIELVSAKVQNANIQSSAPTQSSSVTSDVHSSSSTSNRTDGNALSTSIPPRPKQVVNIGLNEDLSCSYRASKLSSMTIEGIVQVQVKSPRDEGYPFIVRVKDPSHQIKSILENKTYAEPLHETHQNEIRSYSVSIPPKEMFVSVFKYKCNSDLRPVPIRVQTRVRMVGDSCRVALQISSNPSNTTHLTDLNIFMEVPPVVKGETLVTSPAGGVWNENQRHVLWCVSRLASGEKFQLQAQVDLISQEEEGTVGEEREKPHFPVFARCNGSSEQLSNVEITIAEAKSSSISLAMRAARRFRVSHREQSM